jgi:hypothetical protein
MRHLMWVSGLLLATIPAWCQSGKVQVTENGCVNPMLESQLWQVIPGTLFHPKNPSKS